MSQQQAFQEFEKLECCPLCANKSSSIRFSPDVWQCSRCRLNYRNPRPTQSEIIRSYEDGINYSRWQRELAVREALWKKRLALLTRYKKNGKLLDIGTGDGYFLTLTRGIYDVQATEISRTGAEYCRKRGYDTIIGDFLELDFLNDSFDLITLWHVLEHVPEPGNLLKKANKVLKDGGILAIAVPNEWHSLIYRFREKNPFGTIGWGDEIHLTHFTPGVLKTFLRKSSWNIIEFGVDDVHVERPFRTRLFFHGNRLLSKAFGWHCDNAMYLICSKARDRTLSEQ